MDIAHNTVAGANAAAAPPRANATGPRASTRQNASDAGRSVPPRPADARPTISQLINEVRAAFSARFYLFELEAKRAAWSAATMLAFAVGAALLGVTAWLILIGALIVGAVAAGVHWVLAVVVAIALHAVAVFLLVRGIRAMVVNLTFEATRRTLSSSDQPKGPDGSVAGQS